LLPHTDLFLLPRTLLSPLTRTEARGGLHIVEQSLWAAVPSFLRRLSAALKKHTGRELPLRATPFKFGSWMGGDRCGREWQQPRARVVDSAASSALTAAAAAAAAAALVLQGRQPKRDGQDHAPRGGAEQVDGG
jgi:phosphoenolpyruvate carboxylase